MKERILYTTCFDIRYAPKGLALIDSLKNLDPHMEILVLCLDKETKVLFEKLRIKGVITIDTANLEERFPKLKIAKKNRPYFEYVFSLTPFLCSYVLEKFKCSVIYLDADMIFFESPRDAILDMPASCSVAICPHRFPSYNNKSRSSGWFNVGYNLFRNTANSKEVLRSWSEDCLSSTKVNEMNCGDQKYLDKWPSLFSGIHIVSHPGADCAPWNFYNLNVKRKNGKIMVGDKKLIFFHFHGFGIYKNGIFIPNLAYPITPILSEIYSDYKNRLCHQIAKIESVYPKYKELLKMFNPFTGLLPILESLRVMAIKRILKIKQ